jgi:hypothetical protein
MATIINNIYLQNDFVEVEVISEDYRVIVLIDDEDISRIGKVSITNSGYAKTKSQLLHRLLLGCTKGDGNFVDHINGNCLDNRKQNLRVTTDSINKRNLHNFSRNNTGVIGVQYREKGGYKYYRATYRTLDGQRVTKQFNINVLGDEAAFVSAVKWLEDNSVKFGYI